ncbi:MAG TPA: hypothetical protein VMG60_16235 [Burkholderiaceae bacterium]|nr:hypothetical protein [Burkholderiaceae bacterium]
MDDSSPPGPAATAFAVELSRVDVLPGEQAFVLQVTHPVQGVQRLRFPRWALYQLMRLLPQVDAVMMNAGAPGAVAYPVKAWSFGRLAQDGIVVTLRTDTLVDSSFAFDYQAAAAFHFGLGELLDRAEEDRVTCMEPPPPWN